MEGANLGVFYAFGQLDIDDDHYVLSRESPTDEADVQAAGSVLEMVGHLDDEPDMPLMLDSLEKTPDEIERGLSLPLISLLRLKVEALGASRAELAGKVTELLQSERMTHIASALGRLGLLVNGSLTRVSRALLDQRVVSDFGRLVNSYKPLILDLYDAQNHPQQNSFDQRYGRDQYENAIASNQLIANMVVNLREHTCLAERTVLDLGSGGGYFPLSLGARSILFDRSAVANSEAEEMYRKAGKTDLLAGVITGDITDPDDLQAARAQHPDAVTINYILHDIVGQASSYEQGLDKALAFLRHYREIFDDTLLYITESWDISWGALRAGGKSYITLYTWLHGISPQRLLSKAALTELLEQAGFRQEATVVHGRMVIDGVNTPINETIVARAW